MLQTGLGEYPGIQLYLTNELLIWLLDIEMLEILTGTKFPEEL